MPVVTSIVTSVTTTFSTSIASSGKKHFSFLKCFFFIFLLINSAIADDTCLSGQQQLAEVDDWAVAAKIIDGDTVHLRDGRKIRMIGINTPELGRRGKASQPFARKAYQALVKLLKNNKKIGLSYDQDKKDPYKRILAYISLANGQSIAQILLSKGLAYSIVIPPNDSRINCYRSIEKTARNAKLGLWRLAKNKWLKASQLSSKARGQRFLSGIVSAYHESRKSIYLKLSPKLSIRIAKKDRKHFSKIDFRALIGKHLRVRGRVNTYKGRQSIHVRTAYDLHIMSP